MKPINLAKLLSSFDTPWDPKIIAELNGQQVKLVKLEGEFVWHAHANADELFLVLTGLLEMQYRDHTVTVREGELVVVPRGVEHCPRAGVETHVLLFEPAGTLNTGDAGGDRTVADPELIQGAR
ncbi:MAG TPA: cupin domain-containing protein [Thermoanaerobaculales bacterium]|nr:cupin domain-containing protein [Thermoanaerobaculales bacterium]HPA82151.1 cupin domain-containing protein [Thermoanaerobaculales bacterium]HQL28875.1 cupin domain-containing protein [Thermoanaerobaculales bacterium]HQN96366.1 cupin domain-containing protein [Thermoanaerobaculales bacterium]HQP43699.1 cupin domain-containing protein [Thermoanaerobaculales bacterium]